MSPFCGKWPNGASNETAPLLRVDFVALPRRWQPWFWVSHLQPHQSHHLVYTLGIDLVSLLSTEPLSNFPVHSKMNALHTFHRSVAWLPCFPGLHPLGLRSHPKKGRIVSADYADGCGFNPQSENHHATHQRHFDVCLLASIWSSSWWTCVICGFRSSKRFSDKFW